MQHVNTILEMIENRLFREVLGIPFWIIAGPLLLAILYWIIRDTPLRKITVPPPVWACIGVLVTILGMETIVYGGRIGSAIVGTGAIVILLWQLIEGPLLFVRKFQAPILVITLIILAMIAVSGVPMFPATFLPLLFLFVPDNVFSWWKHKAVLRVGEWKLHYIHIFFFLMLCGGAMLIVNGSTGTNPVTRMVVLAISQSFLLGGVALLLIPLIREFLSADRVWKWEGVKVWDGSAPSIFLLFPLVWLLWGMTSYLGLRTSANLSMLSNLRTEGPVSNHIILRNNPLKFWDYQEDRVRIIDLDKGAPEVGHHFAAKGGHSLPLVEFRKLVIMWRESGSKVAMTYQYHSEPVRTEDIVNDANWALVDRNWETFWLDFRAVQDSGPNECRS
jgi:hypothetical protein